MGDTGCFTLGNAPEDGRATIKAGWQKTAKM